jgi:hypothetical protein
MWDTGCLIPQTLLTSLLRPPDIQLPRFSEISINAVPSDRNGLSDLLVVPIHNDHRSLSERRKITDRQRPASFNEIVSASVGRSSLHEQFSGRLRFVTSEKEFSHVAECRTGSRYPGTTPIRRVSRNTV